MSSRHGLPERHTGLPGFEAGAPYPRFSDAEMARRRRAFEDLMASAGVAHALVYGANRNGSAVGWLTGWPVTREAAVAVTPGERDAMFVQFYNHVPNAARMAVSAEVGWAPDAVTGALAEIERRGGRGARIGIVGPLGHRGFRAVAALAAEAVPLDAGYFRLRALKSPEELEWVRAGARLTDAAVAAVRAAARPGTTEYELADAAERAYVPLGGSTHIHYFASTAMSEPGIAVPAQYPARRALQAGDALVCEVSASYWDHPGQLLRTFTVSSAPSALYRDLHATAEAAFDAVCGVLRSGATAAEVVEAAGVIEEAGFTTRDDLLHGFVGGYLEPVLGSPSRLLEPVPEFTFEAGMTVVVQPNVVTRDETAGVQTGELVLVTPTGVEFLHSFERGLLEAG